MGKPIADNVILCLGCVVSSLVCKDGQVRQGQCHFGVFGMCSVFFFLCNEDQFVEDNVIFCAFGCADVVFVKFVWACVTDVVSH